MLRALSLRSFRNYHDSLFSFIPGINGVFGENGSGKTNLLEAISLISIGRSFRGANFEELVLENTESFAVEARFSFSHFEGKISYRASAKEKTLIVNEQRQSSLHAALGMFPTVLLSPRDIALIMGAPADRRRFINIMLSQRSPLYFHHLSRYSRALKQRNVLLKKKDKKLLAAWDEQLVQSGYIITQMRKEVATHLSTHMDAYHRLLSPKQDSISLKYLPSSSATTLEAYRKHLENHLEKDILYATTSYGPHRDDFGILHAEKEAKLYASEGQKRSLISALKCAEWHVLKEATSLPPLFCIDDCCVHLDRERTELLTKLLTTFPQVIITAPEPSAFPLDYFANVYSKTSEACMVSTNA